MGKQQINFFISSLSWTSASTFNAAILSARKRKSHMLRSSWPNNNFMIKASFANTFLMKWAVSGQQNRRKKSDGEKYKRVTKTAAENLKRYGWRSGR